MGRHKPRKEARNRTSPDKLQRSQPWWCLDLRRPTSRTMRKWMYAKPPRPWYFCYGCPRTRVTELEFSPSLPNFKPLLTHPHHNCNPWNYKPFCNLLEAGTMDKHKELCVLIFIFLLITFCLSPAKKSRTSVELPSCSTSLYIFLWMLFALSLWSCHRIFFSMLELLHPSGSIQSKIVSFYLPKIINTFHFSPLLSDLPSMVTFSIGFPICENSEYPYVFHTKKIDEHALLNFFFPINN